MVDALFDILAEFAKFDNVIRDIMENSQLSEEARTIAAKFLAAQ